LLWLPLQLFWSKRVMSKSKAALALVLLIISFFVLAFPYMKLKGAVFPKKNLVQFQPQSVSGTLFTADIIPSDITGAFGKLFKNIGETLMWFFMPALFIGTYKFFKSPKWYEPEQFFIIGFVGLNIVLMVLLYCKAGYMSGRHTLPLVVFTVFYIPVGIQILADLFDKKLFKKGDANLGFVILIVIGMAICSPKLFRPLHQDKLIFRKVAQWLSENTEPGDIIAVPDLRLSFYSARKGVDYKHHSFPKNPNYLVAVSKKKNLSADMVPPASTRVFQCDESEGKYSIGIYKVFD